MDKNTISTIKQKLEEEKVRLEKELSSFAQKDSKIEGNYRSKFPHFGNDEEENAAEVADFDSRLGIEHALESSLRDVNKALERIDKGTYGVCKHCNSPIEEQRLMIRPMSGSCVSCKKKLKGED